MTFAATPALERQLPEHDASSVVAGLLEKIRTPAYSGDDVPWDGKPGATVGMSMTDAGCMVTEGLFKRGNKVRLLRDDVVIFEGSLKSLRRFKDDVREVQQGYECGMAFENYDDIKEGDVIECFEAEEIARRL